MSKFDVKVSFPRVAGGEVVVSFDGGEICSDAGLLLLAQADRRLGLTRRLTECLVDRRQSAKVEQSLHDMLRLRVFGPKRLRYPQKRPDPQAGDRQGPVG